MPISDAFGNTVAVPTPCRIQGLQELSLEFSGDIKEFHGSGQFPLAIAKGKVKVNGKIKGAVMDSTSLNTLYFGTGSTAGTMRAIHADSDGTEIPDAGPYSIPVNVPNGGTLELDLGVLVNGVAYMRVSGVTPTTGQYSVDTETGIYTFAAADAGKRAYISYAYNYASTGARQFALNNLQMGAAPRFRLITSTEFQGKRAVVDLYSITAPKLHLLGGKNDDFSVPELDYQASVDDSGFSLGTLTLSE